MPSQLRKQSAGGGWGSLGSGLPGGCSWAVAGPPGGEPRRYSGRGHGRCRRCGTPLAVTHAGVSRAGRVRSWVHEKYICGARGVDDGGQAGSQGALLSRIS
jgi:ribosomal protein S14